MDVINIFFASLIGVKPEVDASSLSISTKKNPQQKANIPTISSMTAHPQSMAIAMQFKTKEYSLAYPFQESQEVVLSKPREPYKKKKKKHPHQTQQV
jgi:hypothetical protein